MKKTHILLIGGLLFASGKLKAADEPVRLQTAPQKQVEHVVAGVDPVEAKGGDVQVLVSIALVLPDEDGQRSDPALLIDLREWHGRVIYSLWHHGEHLSKQIPNPEPAGWVDNGEYQHPEQTMFREGEGYRLRLFVWPEQVGSRVRLFVDSMDRPKEDYFPEERVKAGAVKLFASQGGNAGEPARTSIYSGISFKKLTQPDAEKLPGNREIVIRSIDSWRRLGHSDGPLKIVVV